MIGNEGDEGRRYGKTNSLLTGKQEGRKQKGRKEDRQPGREPEKERKVRGKRRTEEKKKTWVSEKGREVGRGKNLRVKNERFYTRQDSLVQISHEVRPLAGLR